MDTRAGLTPHLPHRDDTCAATRRRRALRRGGAELIRGVGDWHPATGHCVRSPIRVGVRVADTRTRTCVRAPFCTSPRFPRGCLPERNCWPSLSLRQQGTSPPPPLTMAGPRHCRRQTRGATRMGTAQRESARRAAAVTAYAMMRRAPSQSGRVETGRGTRDRSGAVPLTQVRWLASRSMRCRARAASQSRRAGRAVAHRPRVRERAPSVGAERQRGRLRAAQLLVHPAPLAEEMARQRDHVAAGAEVLDAHVHVPLHGGGAPLCAHGDVHPLRGVDDPPLGLGDLRVHLAVLPAVAVLPRHADGDRVR
eukprot:gene5526-biopygen8325